MIQTFEVMNVKYDDCANTLKTSLLEELDELLPLRWKPSI